MVIEKITNISDERLNIFYKKKESTFKNMPEYENGIFVAESSLVINRALDKNYEPICFLIVENEVDTFMDIFNRCNEDIIIYEVSQEIYKSLKGYVLIKGILGLFNRKSELTFNEVVDNKKRIVVLEEVVNPTNVGTIFRNAAALFCDGVLLTDDSCDPLYRRSIRVSMGNVFNINYAFVNKNNYIEQLQEKGFKIVSFALKENSVEISDERLNNEEKLAIVFGSEGYGLNQNTIEKSDYVVKISMNNEVDSLNVAACSSIALWQLCKNNQ